MCDVFGAEVEALMNGLSGQQIKDEIGLRSRRFFRGNFDGRGRFQHSF